MQSRKQAKKLLYVYLYIYLFLCFFFARGTKKKKCKYLFTMALLNRTQTTLVFNVHCTRTRCVSDMVLYRIEHMSTEQHILYVDICI